MPKHMQNNFEKKNLGCDAIENGRAKIFSQFTEFVRLVEGAYFKLLPGEPCRLGTLVRTLGEVGSPHLSGEFRRDFGILFKERYRNTESEIPGHRFSDFIINELGQRVVTLDGRQISFRHMDIIFGKEVFDVVKQNGSAAVDFKVEITFRVTI